MIPINDNLAKHVDCTKILTDDCFFMTAALKKTMNYPYVLDILAGRSKKPSELAGLKSEDELCVALQWIDEIYTKAISGYITDFLNAAKEDMRVFDNDYKALAEGNAVIGFFKFNAAMWASLARHVFRKTPYHIIDFEKCSAYRVKILLAIDIKEKERIEEVGKIIHNYAIPLITKIQKLKRSNQNCNWRMNELTQLVKVFKAHFPRDRFQVNTGNKVFEITL